MQTRALFCSFPAHVECLKATRVKPPLKFFHTAWFKLSNCIKILIEEALLLALLYIVLSAELRCVCLLKVSMLSRPGLQRKSSAKAMPNAPAWTAAPASTSEPWLHVTANSMASELSAEEPYASPDKNTDLFGTALRGFGSYTVHTL